MIDYLYEWVRGIAYYMVLVTVVMQMTAAESYRKYIRLFTGIILVLMILAPVMRIFGINGEEIWMQEEGYEELAQNVEEKIEELEREISLEMPPEPEGGLAAGGGMDAGVLDGGFAEGQQEKETGRIEVGEIRIGR